MSPDLTTTEQRVLDRLDAQRAKLVVAHRVRLAAIDQKRRKLLNIARVRKHRAKQS
jgi:hypothetical protein